ncbi:unnamed protein product [Euphydryas editha]|uniref:Uncharacterized protein n=1 Tax=Euphydryas editha TaxID=104508 RepID=A0AAU9TRU9_EUPED|nr:unnamed protein product [Euphydryas editha]
MIPVGSSAFQPQRRAGAARRRAAASAAHSEEAEGRERRAVDDSRHAAHRHAAPLHLHLAAACSPAA